MSRRPINQQSDATLTRLFKEQVEAEIKRKQREGKPIATIDPETQKPCLIYPDGRKEYA